MVDSHDKGFIRLRDILAPRGPFPVSKSTWWAGVKSGRYPQPVKLGPRITAWRIADILKLCQGMTNAAPPSVERDAPKRAVT